MLKNLKIGKKKSEKQPPQKEWGEKSTTEEKLPDGRTVTTIRDDEPGIRQTTKIYSSPQEASEPPFSEDLDTSSQQTSEASHFDDLIQETEQVEQVEKKEASKSKLLSRAEFQKSFIGLHGFGAAMTGLKSLAIPNTHIDEPTGREVADAVYDTIMEIPLLHPLLAHGNKYIGRIITLICYGEAMRQAVTLELAQRNADKGQTTQQKSEPAPPTMAGGPNSEQREALTGRA